MKLWKISHMLMVRKAMVMPSSERSGRSPSTPDFHAVADEVGGQRNDGDQHALIDHVDAQTAGENAVAGCHGAGGS